MFFRKPETRLCRIIIFSCFLGFQKHGFGCPQIDPGTAVAAVPHPVPMETVRNAIVYEQVLSVDAGDVRFARERCY